MVDNNSGSMVKYAVAGIGAIAMAGLVYYLSSDDFVALDYKRYNVEKFEVLMNELNLEFTCIYTRNYNTYLKIKENGEGEDDLIDRVKLQVEREL